MYIACNDTSVIVINFQKSKTHAITDTYCNRLQDFFIYNILREGAPLLAALSLGWHNVNVYVSERTCTRKCDVQLAVGEHWPVKVETYFLESLSLCLVNGH